MMQSCAYESMLCGSEGNLEQIDSDFFGERLLYFPDIRMYSFRIFPGALGAISPWSDLLRTSTNKCINAIGIWIFGEDRQSRNRFM